MNRPSRTSSFARAAAAAALLSLGCGASATPAPAGGGAAANERDAQDALSPDSAEGPAPALADATGIPAPAVPPPPPPPPPPQLVTLRVVAAEIDGRMANGEHWDDKSSSAATTPVSLPRYLAGHPELAAALPSLGIPHDDPTVLKSSQSSVAADPMVFIEVGPQVFRSPVRPRSFNPVWDFALHFAVGDRTQENHGLRELVDPTELVRIHIVDYDGPEHGDTIGSLVITVAELLATRVHTFGPFGGVRKLVIEANPEPIPAPPTPTSLRLAVPGNAPWTDTGLMLTAGDSVTIEAADEVCSKGGDLGYCSGPEGQRRTSSYNAPYFPKLGHASLLAAVGDTRFAVGRSLTFIAPSSGPLRLGINDRDVSDNSGAYAVFITTSPAR